MSVIFDLATMPPTDRAEALDSVVTASDSVRVEIDHAVAAERIAGVGSVSDIGGVDVFSVRSSPLTIRRTPRYARDDFEPSLVLGMQLSGSSLIVQDGREAVVAAGDMKLVDTTRPYTSVNPSGAHYYYFRIPRSQLALPDDVLRSVTAVRLGGRDPLPGLVSTFFRALVDRSASLASAPGAGLVDRPAVELVRAMICGRVGRADLARGPLANTLALRVMRYVRTHLGDQDLTAASIARAHHVSVRHLYAVLAKADIALGESIRTMRLEACRRDLSRPGAESLTIAAIAHRWGFGDATNFGRAFKDAYGMSPRQWRELNRRP